MGQFEKLVVLSVLLIVAVILAISLGSSGDGLPAPGGGEESVARTELRELPAVTPERALDDRVEPQRRQTAAPAGDGPAGPVAERAAGEARGELAGTRADEEPTRPAELERERLARTAEELLAAEPRRPAPKDEGDLLLEASLGAEEEPAALHGAPAPKGSALLGLADLEPTFDPELMEYTWRRGDTFATVARRLYGDASYSELLRLCNEGRTYVPEGASVLVPVYDRRGAAHLAGDTREPEPSGAVRWYTVEEGDSLWAISKKCYGSGAKWQRIYEANRDRLTSPDDVYAGLQLALPQ